jgi:hypothetical protein
LDTSIRPSVRVWSNARRRGAVEREVDRMPGPRGLMILFRADQGKFTSLSGDEKHCSLYLVGNPVIVNQIISIDLRACFYVPRQGEFSSCAQLFHI